MKLLELPLPEPRVVFNALPLFCLLFFRGALGEELGWTDYDFELLQGRYGTLGAGSRLG